MIIPPASPLSPLTRFRDSTSNGFAIWRKNCQGKPCFSPSLGRIAPRRCEERSDEAIPGLCFRSGASPDTILKFQRGTYMQPWMTIERLVCGGRPSAAPTSDYSI